MSWISLSPRRPHRAVAARTFRPTLEGLEDRCLLDAASDTQVLVGNIFGIASQVIKSLDLQRQTVVQDLEAIKQALINQAVSQAQTAQQVAPGSNAGQQVLQNLGNELNTINNDENQVNQAATQAEVGVVQTANDIANQIVIIRLGQPGQIVVPPGTGGGGGGGGGGFFGTQTLQGQFAGQVTDDGSNDPASAGVAVLSGPATIVLTTTGDVFNSSTTVSGGLMLTQNPSAALRQSGAIGNGIPDDYGGQYTISGTVTNGTMNLVLSGATTLVATGSVNGGNWQFQGKANGADFGAGQYSFS
jgi:hypothetical protein